MPKATDRPWSEADHRPSAFYFRDALRASTTKAEAIAIGLHVVRELENLSNQMHAAGIRPAPRFVLQSEVEDKNLRPHRVPLTLAELASNVVVDFSAAGKEVARA